MLRALPDSVREICLYDDVACLSQRRQGDLLVLQFDIAKSVSVCSDSPMNAIHRRGTTSEMASFVTGREKSQTLQGMVTLGHARVLTLLGRVVLFVADQVTKHRVFAPNFLCCFTFWVRAGLI